MKDDEVNRFSARAARYARVGANIGGVAARIAAARLIGARGGDAANAAALAQALGSLKGPMMKVAQMMATIPDILPPEYADELQKLQADAPPMGAAFVRRRMQAELGANWRSRFQSFELHPAAAASLGQVHRAVAQDSGPLACKLQYPDMKSAVEADLSQLEILFALHRRFNPVIDTRDITLEIGERVREELDYGREAKHATLYRGILSPFEDIRVPKVRPELSTERLLTMEWLEGGKLLSFTGASETSRARIAAAMFKAWWIPFSQFGVIHGDPHLGNYAVFEKEGEPAGINLLDYGCIRIFKPTFVAGVIDLYAGPPSQRLPPHLPRLRDLGVSWPDQGAGRNFEYLGPFYLRSFARRPSAHRRRRRISRPIWPQTGLSSASGPETDGAGPRSARICVHGSGRDRPRRGFSSP